MFNGGETKMNLSDSSPDDSDDEDSEVTIKKDEMTSGKLLCKDHSECESDGGKEKREDTHVQKTNKKNLLISFVPQVCNDIAKFVENKVLVKKSMSRSSSSSSLLSTSGNVKDDTSSLISAIRSRSMNKVRNLLETQSVDIDGKDSKGVTAIHEASICGQLDTIKLLVLHDATLNRKDNEGHTCLDYAVFGGHFECAKYLIECGASPENIQNGVPSHFGKTNFA